MIPFEEAKKIVLEEIGVSDAVEEVPAVDALRRILRENVVSDEDVPAFDNSAMDGFALRAEDTESAPVRLRVVADLPAGKLLHGTLRPGEAVRIMTGAPIPEGADAVVIVEETEGEGETVLIKKPVEKGANIRLRGEDVSKGSLVLREGTSLRPQDIGVLGSIGRVVVRVAQKPRVAVLSTGDEIIPCHRSLSPGQVRNSNTFTLVNMIRRVGAEPVGLGITPDEPEKLLDALRQARSCDVLITTGGVSVGDYDFVKDILCEHGLELRFWKVAIKPGKPVAFGLLRGKPVFALPGNPVAVMVTFEHLVRPALLKMMGAHSLEVPIVNARLHSTLKKSKDRFHFVCGHCWIEDGEFNVEVRGAQGSGILTSMVLANCFIMVHPDSPSYKPGDRVKIELLDRPDMR